MSLLTSYGSRQLFSGLRRGNTGAAGVGAALLLVGVLRDRRRPRKRLLYARNLSEGEAVRIRLLRGTSVVDETDVEG